MPEFMDLHEGMVGVSKEQIEAAHQEDMKHEREEGVHFKQWWADPDTGKVFCLSEGPSKEAVERVHQKAGHPAAEIYEVKLHGE